MDEKLTDIETDCEELETGDEEIPALYEHFKFVADKGQNLLRVDKFLVARIENASRNRIQQAAEAKCILVNGNPVKSNYRVKPLDVVSVVMDRPRYESEIIPENIPLNIVYEDKEVLVVNKPAGLVVHPGHGNYSGTLVNALAYYFRNDPLFDVSDPRLGLVPSCPAHQKCSCPCISHPVSHGCISYRRRPHKAHRHPAGNASQF